MQLCAISLYLTFCLNNLTSPSKIWHFGSIMYPLQKAQTNRSRWLCFSDWGSNLTSHWFISITGINLVFVWSHVHASWWAHQASAGSWSRATSKRCGAGGGRGPGFGENDICDWGWFVIGAHNLRAGTLQPFFIWIESISDFKYVNHPLQFQLQFGFNN